MPDDLSNASAGNTGGAVATAVRELIEGVRAGEPMRAGGLTLVPLLPATEQVRRQSGYLPLEEALRRNLVTITEQAQASVPELVASTTSETPVVLVGGEQVIGGLQNRVLNTTILVAAHVTQKIPVTCVEAGRWHDSATYSAGYEAPRMSDNIGQSPSEIRQTAATPGQNPTTQRQAARAFRSDEAAYAKLRHMHAKSVTMSLSSGGGHRSDQGAVWGEVSERMMSTGSYSPSNAMDMLYKSPERASRLQETMEALQRPEGALGFVAMLGASVLGAELFTDEALAAAYWEKLARSYAVEALDASPQSGEGETGNKTDADEAVKIGEARLLTEALAADIQVHPSPGLGEDARLMGSHVSGAGLVYDGAVVHLSLFPEDETSGASGEGSESQPAQTPRRYGGHRQTTS